MSHRKSLGKRAAAIAAGETAPATCCGAANSKAAISLPASKAQPPAINASLRKLRRSMQIGASALRSHTSSERTAGKMFHARMVFRPAAPVERNVVVGTIVIPAGLSALQIGADVRVTSSRAKRRAWSRTENSMIGCRLGGAGRARVA
jgi:hypothetical protein